MVRVKGRRKKKRTTQPVPQEEQLKVPHSMVFKKHQVGFKVRNLIHDWQKVNLPYTAKKLEVKANQSISSLVTFAKSFGVKTFHVFSCPSQGAKLKICSVPAGPTAEFGLESFQNMREILRETTKRHPGLGGDPDYYRFPPLLILNNFGKKEGKHWELLSTMLQHMFPLKEMEEIKLGEVKRALLWNAHKGDSNLIDVRHYFVVTQRSGLSRLVKKVARNKTIKKLHKVDSVEKLLDDAEGYSSEDSEAEAPKVMLAQPTEQIPANTMTYIKLVEVGPRMTLDFRAVQAGLLGGKNLWSSENPHSKSGEEDWSSAVGKSTSPNELDEELIKKLAKQKLEREAARAAKKGRAGEVEDDGSDMEEEGEEEEEDEDDDGAEGTGYGDASDESEGEEGGEPELEVEREGEEYSEDEDSDGQPQAKRARMDPDWGQDSDDADDEDDD